MSAIMNWGFGFFLTDYGGFASSMIRTVIQAL